MNPLHAAALSRIRGAMRCAILMPAALAACAHLGRQTPAPAPPPEPPSVATPEPDSQPAQPEPPSAASAPPPCLPESPTNAQGDAKAQSDAKADVKPRSKPAKHNARVTSKPAPPQLPTAPAVAQTPPGGVVDAEVKPMPVAVMSILGKRVQGPKGEDMGRVADVLADSSGRVRVAIIDFGGFLGVGDRRIAVDWPLLRFSPDEHDPSLILSVSRDRLQSAPIYKDNARPQTLMEPAPTATAPAAAPAAVPASGAPASNAPAAADTKH